MRKKLLAVITAVAMLALCTPALAFAGTSGSDDPLGNGAAPEVEAATGNEAAPEAEAVPGVEAAQGSASAMEGESAQADEKIEFYSDDACVYEISDNIDVDKSKSAEATSFYVRYPKNDTLAYKVGSRHMITIKKTSEGDGNTCTFWRLEDSGNNMTYYDYDDNEKITDPKLIYAIERACKNLDSARDYVDVTPVSGYSSEDYCLSKVSLKANNGNEYRGSEDFRFIFSLIDKSNSEVVAGSEKTIDLNYGVEIEYDADAIGDLDADYAAFDKLIDPNSESAVELISTSGSMKTVFLDNLGSMSTGRDDLRHGVGPGLWIAPNDGYQITGIYDTVNNNAKLPYYASLVSYFDVYNGSTKVNVKENNSWWGGTWSADENDVIKASAFTTSQSLAKSSATSDLAESDKSFNDFNAGSQDTSDFYDACGEKDYTSKLLGTHIIYTIYMPLEKQCKIKIETKKADYTNDFTEGSTETGIKYDGTIDKFNSQKITLAANEKEAINKTLKEQYGDKQLADVYEINGTISGSANIAIPKSNAKDYEIVWLTDNSASSRLEPVPMLSQTSEKNDAKFFTTGHCSKYALIESSPSVEPVVSVSTVNGVKAKAKGKAKAKVYWNKISEASGYQIAKKRSGKKYNYQYTNVTSSKSNLIFKKLKKHKKYYFKVRAYKISNGQTYYGEWSNAQKVKIR